MYLDARRQHDKKFKKDLEGVRRDTVRKVTQMISLSAVVHKGYDLQHDDAEKVKKGAEHFYDALQKFMSVDDAAPYKWKEELEAMVTQWTRLVLGYKDPVPGADMSYKDLSAALTEISANLPAVIEFKKEEPPEE